MGVADHQDWGRRKGARLVIPHRHGECPLGEMLVGGGAEGSVGLLGDRAAMPSRELERPVAGPMWARVGWEQEQTPDGQAGWIARWCGHGWW